MVVVLDDDVKDVISRFNLDVYNNIDGIVQLLMLGSCVNVDSVFLSKISYNKLNMFCSCDKKFELLLENRNDFFENCLVLSDNKKSLKYEFSYDKDFNLYSLKLLSLILKRHSNLNVEVMFYGYGSHINVYFGNKIYSFDVQGNLVDLDFYKFERLIDFNEYFNLEDLLEMIYVCVDEKNIDKILVDEYENNCLVRNIILTENNGIKSRVIRLKKKKC